jgi:outer membrane protein assembly factor BamB
MGNLFCFDGANKGKIVWSHDCVKEFGSELPVWGFAGHPLVDGDKLICLVGGSEGRLVMAFNKKTGETLWKALSVDGDFGYCPPMIHDIGGKRTLLIWHPKAMVGLDPEKGTKLWEQEWSVFSSLTAVTPRVFKGNHIFLSAFYNGSLLFKVEDNKPSVVWKSKSKGDQRAVAPDNTVDLHSIMTTPVIKDNNVYGICSYGELRCLDVMTGERKWHDMKATRGALTTKEVAAKNTPASSERWGHAFIIEHQDRYFLFNEQGDLIIAKLTPEKYIEVDRAHILDPTNKMAFGRPTVWMHPAFAAKCMFARNDKEIVCVSLAK